jgi:hypothetical protein
MITAAMILMMSVGTVDVSDLLPQSPLEYIISQTSVVWDGNEPVAQIQARLSPSVSYVCRNWLSEGTAGDWNGDYHCDLRDFALAAQGDARTLVIAAEVDDWSGLAAKARVAIAEYEYENRCQEAVSLETAISKF